MYKTQVIPERKLSSFRAIKLDSLISGNMNAADAK